MQVLRPKVQRLKTFAEAAAAVDTLLADQAQRIDDAASDDGSEDGDRSPVRDGDEEEDAAVAPTEDDPTLEEEQEDEVVLIREQRVKDEMDQEAEGDFDREFARMLTDTTDVRRAERKAAPIFDTAVPLIKKRQGQSTAHETSNAPSPQDNATGGMHFTLLSKKGNKQQLRNLDIPLDSAIAVNSMSHQQRNKAEQEQLKRLVLQNERRQEKSELLCECCAFGSGRRQLMNQRFKRTPGRKGLDSALFLLDGAESL